MNCEPRNTSLPSINSNTVGTDLDVEETQTVICYGMFYVLYACQMFHVQRLVMNIRFILDS